MSHRLINLVPAAPSIKAAESSSRHSLVDGHGRRISYLRLSVTDRCDLRCTYCMPEQMRFLPKKDVLSFEELALIVDEFIASGVTKLRITGGEPLVRKDVMSLLERFSSQLGQGKLEEICLTTNGVRLAQHAERLAELGVKRVNVSLDTLDRFKFQQLTRRDSLHAVLDGLKAAKSAGLKIKINTVALADANQQELPDLIQWAHGEGFDLSLIEVMPMGEGVDGRSAAYVSLQTVLSELKERWTLTPDAYTSGGPSRYMNVKETGGRLGIISPLSHNFCGDCNRIRMTCTGRLYTCLGREDGADLRNALRQDPTLDTLRQAIGSAIGVKPKQHDFTETQIDTPSSPRTMSTTGG